MPNINNLDYAALNLSGDNYLQWALDTKICLRSKGLGECIVDDNNATEKEKYQAIVIIRHHLTEGLKNQYLTIEDPLELWKELRSRYDHHKMILLPKATYDWKHLRIQDFKTVDEYNSELYKIVSIMRLCGETVTEKDLLEKTFSTFHSSNVLLQQQYRQKGFETYSDLISCLLLAETNNELLMRNSQMRLPGSTPLPEAHKADVAEKDSNQKESNHVQRYNKRGRGAWRGRGGRGNHNGRDYHHPYNRGQGHHNNRGRGSKSFRGRGRGGRGSNTTKSVCHRCGMGNHWAKNCRTPKHLVDLYQESMKGKNPETNLIQDENGDFDHENDDLMDYETSDVLKD